MPIMQANWKKQETISRLKKVHSTMQNALSLSAQLNGTMVDWKVPRAEANQARYLGDKYLLPYLNVLKVCNENENTCSYKVKDSVLGYEGTVNSDYILADGTTIFILSDYLDFYMGGSDDFFRVGVSQFGLAIDINGSAKPNRVGKDLFYVFLYTINNSIVADPKFGSSDRQLLKDQCLYSGLSCYGLIMSDGWKISEDYPR